MSGPRATGPRGRVWDRPGPPPWPGPGGRDGTRPPPPRRRPRRRPGRIRLAVLATLILNTVEAASSPRSTNTNLAGRPPPPVPENRPAWVRPGPPSGRRPDAGADGPDEAFPASSGDVEAPLDHLHRVQAPAGQGGQVGAVQARAPGMRKRPPGVRTSSPRTMPGVRSQTLTLTMSLVPWGRDRPPSPRSFGFPRRVWEKNPAGCQENPGRRGVARRPARRRNGPRLRRATPLFPAL